MYGASCRPGTGSGHDTIGKVRPRKRRLQPHRGIVFARAYGTIEVSECPVVAIVDDDISVRESLPELLKQAGFAVRAFASAEAFLNAAVAGGTSCLVLDIGLPGMSGPELQRELARRKEGIPVVFITARGDKALQPRLLAAGAVACLFKPFSDTDLIEAVEAATGRR